MVSGKHFSSQIIMIKNYALNMHAITEVQSLETMQEGNGHCTL
jgi:hypothetical protein